MKKRQNPQRRRRLTPTEADALVAHLSPEERRRRIDALVAILRGMGVEVELFHDAAGRSYFKINIEQLQEKSPLLAAVYEQLVEIAPEPSSHRPKTA